MSKADLFGELNEFETKTVPFGGTEVTLQQPRTSQIRKWRKSYRRKDGSPDPERMPFVEEAILAITLVDEDGKFLFTFSEIYGGCFDDVNGARLNRLVSMALEHAGIRDSEDEDTQDLVNAAKNSSETSESESSSNSSGEPA